MCWPRNSPSDQLTTCCNKLVSSGKDIPVVAVVNSIDEAGFSDVLSAGVRNIALRHKPQQLLAAVRSEWEDLDARRSLRRLEAQVRETERRCDALIESSREPIAYVHEGMLSGPIRLPGDFGSRPSRISKASLLDLVAPQHVRRLQQ